MHAAVWSTLGGVDCIRVTGGGDVLEVRVDGAPEGFPAVAGAFAVDGRDRCFVPRFPFAAGVGHLVVDSDGRASAPLRRPAATPAPSTTVLRILPTADTVPRNLLRFAIEFSAPMSEDGAATSIRLVADDGRDLTDALLQSHSELWDADHRRLTVLLDPGRIKQGLARHERDGYPLPADGSFRILVDAAMRDAGGARLLHGAERGYRVIDLATDRVDLRRWRVIRPGAGTTEPLEIVLERPLDHALLQRCLRVLGPDGRPVAGRAEIGPEERSWRFVPATGWLRTPHRIAVDSTLEDLAGNSVARPFDRDLSAPDPGETLETLEFEPA